MGDDTDAIAATETTDELDSLITLCQILRLYTYCYYQYSYIVSVVVEDNIGCETVLGHELPDLVKLRILLVGGCLNHLINSFIILG